MVSYWVKTPAWLKKLFPAQMIWDMPATSEPVVYLTFDDGPHPTATPFVIQQMEQYKGTATFFCIGKNVVEHPEIYNQLIRKGHTVANHSHNHLNGWHTDNATYIRNILTASKHIQSHSFRPPYGRIKLSQARRLGALNPSWRIYMWGILSADFDTNITPEKCLENVLTHIQPGAIIVFHDSEKAWERMSYALPKVLAYCQSKNWAVKALPKY